MVFFCLRPQNGRELAAALVLDEHLLGAVDGQGGEGAAAGGVSGARPRRPVARR